MTVSDPGTPKRIELCTHERMTNWFSPAMLLLTGVRAAIAATFGAFADAREMQAALTPAAVNPPIQLDREDTMWIDYVADTGDGWDATYSVAYAISSDQLDVSGAADEESEKDKAATLPRGDLLVLGGDQVYPTPAQAAYRTRFLDPFRAAFPADIPPKNPPEDPCLVAIPGNHDWYDGLRSFMRLFCSADYIGRWRTCQHTSYFIVKLPHRWWLWGVDLQLDSGLDRPQHEYFKAAADLLKPGDRVILCAPEPSWIDEGERRKKSSENSLLAIERQTPRFKALREIEGLITKQDPARLALVVAGDLHHYAHYTPAEGGDAPQRITCGGGGAFLLGTHDLPKTLRFRSKQREERYRRHATFPDAEASRGLRNQAWKLPLRNPAFCLFLGVVYLLYMWLLQAVSHLMTTGNGELTLMDILASDTLGWSELAGLVARSYLQILAHSPAAVLLTLAIVLGSGAFTRAGVKERRKAAFIGGMLHGVLHLGIALLLASTLVRGAVTMGLICDAFSCGPARDLLRVVLYVLQVVVFASVGGLLFGLWMMLTNRWFGWHAEEVFSSQGIADYKCFLRMRIDASGLTIYPLKIRKVCTRWQPGRGIEVLKRIGRTWRLRASAGSGPRFEPKGAPIRVELIQSPIVIRTEGETHHEHI